MPSMFDSREQLITHLREDMGITEQDKLEEIADTVMEEANSDEGNPETLLQSIKNGAKNLMTDIGLETVSWVQNPSQDSMFVMMKNSEDRIQKTTSIYKEPEESDWSTVYGPVMRPNDIDKDGDVAPASDIKKAAHEFIAEGKVTQFDTDHDLNTGKGTLVESWILKEDKEYELPNGETETIEKGSWMVGVQPNQEVKQRIKDGDITGWSIFGQADQISLKQQANFKTNENNAFKQEDTMPENQSNNDGKDSGELSIKDVHSELKEIKSEFKEYADSPEPTTVKSVDELEKHLENLEKDSTVVELGKDVELTSKEPDFDDLSEMVSYMEDNLMEGNFEMLENALTESEDTVEEEMHGDEDDDEDKAYDSDEDEEEKQEKQEEQEKEEEVEKSEDLQPNYKAQGKQGVGTNVEKSGGSFSYRDLTNEA